MAKRAAAVRTKGYRDMRRLDGKTILVAGAGGIGTGLARRLASEGARVMLGDIDQAGAEAAAAGIRAQGGVAVPIRLDGADEQSVADAVQACLAEFGRIDGAHLNFATFVDDNDDFGIMDLPLDVYDETIRVNQRGFVLCTRAILPHLIESGGGALLYTSSIAAYRAIPSRVAYAMAKAAGHALMRHVATRYAEFGVRANVIAPGTIMHGKWADVLPQSMKDRLLSSQLVKSRLGKPDDIAAVSAMLLSEEGAFITGQVICVDGGSTTRA
jgi:NAD(P)-dependent dehydrogenase (short-subunit alcohol dehydrogenase family)